MAKRRYQMTERRILKLVREGRGTGALAAYRPWLTIHDMSSHGRSHRILGGTTGRIHHLMSDNERDVFLECDHAEAVVDIREQFPLPREDTIAIAQRLGFRHPMDRGVDIVMTTDLVVDVATPRGVRQVAIAVKPDGDQLVPRVAEKLAIERAFWEARGVRWVLVTSAKTSKVRRGNLLWMSEWRTLDGLDQTVEYWARRALVVETELARPRGRTLAAFLRGVERRAGFEFGEAMSALRHLVAVGRVRIDIDRELEVDGPVSQLVLSRATAGCAQAA